MKCQHCGAEIKADVQYCDVCGQPVSESTKEKKAFKSFWTSEYDKKKEVAVEELAGLRDRSDSIQDEVVRGKKLKSKRWFFRIMLLLFAAILAAAIIKGRDAYQSGNIESTKYFVAFSITLIVHLGFLTMATIVANKGGKGLLYLLIPVFGLYYFVFYIFCGIIRMIAPLKSAELACVRSLRKELKAFRSLKKDEKRLKRNLNLMDSGVFQTDKLSYLRKRIVVAKKKSQGWNVTSIFAIIILGATFVAAIMASPMIIDMGIAERVLDALYEFFRGVY